MKVALVYDRVNKWGGAERVLMALHEIFSDAPLYTSVYSPAKAAWAKIFPKVIPSFLNKIPLFRERHELLGTLTPLAFESFDFSSYDVVISVTSEAAKGIITRPGTHHICYCLTPTRYLWSHHQLYFRNKFLKFFSKPLVSYLRNWDKIAAQRPDEIVAISRAVRERIKNYYGRDAKVIYPPVEIDEFTDGEEAKKKFFLVAGRLVPYKRVDLAVNAFNKLGYPLLVVGTGSEERKIRRLAKENIKFVGEVSDQKLATYYREAAALIVPQEEDFGIVSLEAQAAGTPVIAYHKGGSLDTVINGKTGIFFEKQTVTSLTKAVKSFTKMKFEKRDLLTNATRFSKERFKKEFVNLISKNVTLE
ncbi:MAG: glycosyltransferase [Patescibacteria group bacterium]